MDGWLLSSVVESQRGILEIMTSDQSWFGASIGNVWSLFLKDLIILMVMLDVNGLKAPICNNHLKLEASNLHSGSYQKILQPRNKCRCRFMYSHFSIRSRWSHDRQHEETHTGLQLLVNYHQHVYRPCWPQCRLMSH